jgi:PAS domain S-box-containing protein
MKITTALKINSLLTAVVVIIMGIIFTVSFVLRQNTMKMDAVAMGIVTGAFELNALNNSYLSRPEDRPLEQWKLKQMELQQRIKNSSIQNNEQRVLLKRIDDNLTAMGKLFQRIASSYESGRTLPRSSNENRLAAQQLVRLMSLYSLDLVRDASQLAEENHKKVAAVDRIIWLFIPASALVMVGIAMWFSAVLIRRIGKPFAQLSAGAEIIGSGNLDYRFGIRSNDEVGDLASAFDSMTTRLKQITVSRDELAGEIEERKRTEEALRGSEERFRLMGDTIPYGAWMADGEGRNIYISSLFLELVGMTFEQVKEFGWTGKMTPEDVEPMMRRWMECVRTGRDWEGEMRFPSPDGRWHTILSRGKPVRNAQGQIKAWVGINLDITDRKRAEVEIRRLNDKLIERNEQLEFSNKEMESFIYSVSHDLRAPLRHIAGFADLLEKNIADKLDDKGKRYFSLIHDGSEKMSRLIDDLLNLSRISRQEIRRTEVNMSAIAASIIKELREAQPNRNVEVYIREGVTAIADRGLIEIALSNLLGNAWKFTTKTKFAHIEFDTIEKDGKVIYYVRDNGAGFDQQYAGKMFWPFHRLHSEGVFEGTGIGLAIVERVIRGHGGKVWAEGTEGKGATIYFSLA